MYFLNRRKRRSLKKSTIFSAIIFSVSFFLVLLIFGAIPFFSMPTLGQALWSSGFAQSFANNGWPSVFASNFGIPVDAPIVFGLSGAFLQSTIISLSSIHPADAYSLTNAILLGIAFWGAVRLCRFFGIDSRVASLLAVVYFTLPIVWWHSQYSYLAIGFSFLPLYFWMSLRLWEFSPQQKPFSSGWSKSFLMYLSVSLLAVFTDGYTFVMFQTASVIILIIAFFRKDFPGITVIKNAGGIFILSLIISFTVYSVYVGGTGFTTSSMDFFRGWSVDLVMLLSPSRGVSWFFDTLGVSAVRSGKHFFGDASVWMTTFSLPFFVLGAYGLYSIRKSRYFLPLLFVSLTGLYLALGPSLKINSLRPYDSQGKPLVQGQTMPSKLAVMPTGNSLIFRNVPGFRNMRAVYRWQGLCLVSLFVVLILLFKKMYRKKRIYPWAILMALVLLNLPNLPHRIRYTRYCRKAVSRLDMDMGVLLSILRNKDKVLFLPIANDFIVNYLASVGKFRVYNIGGDKNLFFARKNWPDALRSLKLFRLPDNISERIPQLLRKGICNYIVLAHFDKLWGAHAWPRRDKEIIKHRKMFQPVLSALKNENDISIVTNKLFTLIYLPKQRHKIK